jgi:hypothetical protein
LKLKSQFLFNPAMANRRNPGGIIQQRPSFFHPFLFSRNDAVEKRSCGSSSCDAPVAAGVGDASSPEPAAQPNRAPVFSRDEGVAFTFCDEASPLPLAATASFRFSVWLKTRKGLSLLVGNRVGVNPFLQMAFRPCVGLPPGGLLGGTVEPVGFPDIGLQEFALKVLAHGHHEGNCCWEVELRPGDGPRYFQISVPVLGQRGAWLGARGWAMTEIRLAALKSHESGCRRTGTLFRYSFWVGRWGAMGV